MPLLEALIYGYRRIYDEDGVELPTRSRVKFLVNVTDDQENDVTLVGLGEATTWRDGGASKAEDSIRTTPGKFWQTMGRNTGGSTVYVFFYDATARPSNAVTTHLFAPIKVEAGEWFSLEVERGRALTAGLRWAASSTDAALTYASGATLNIAVEHSG